MIKVKFNIFIGSRVFISMYRYILFFCIFILHTCFVYLIDFYNYSDIIQECIKKET